MFNALKLSVVVLMAVLGVVSQAQASLIVGDDFSYSNGALKGNDGGTNGDANNYWGLPAQGIGSAWGGDGGNSVSGGWVSYNGENKDQRWLTTNFAGEKDATPLYWSATLKVNTTDPYEAYLAIGAYNSTDLGSAGKNMLAIGVRDIGFTALACASQSNVGSASVGTTYLVVGKTTFNNDTRIWVGANAMPSEGAGAIYTTSVTGTYDTNWLTPGRVDIQGFGATGVSLDNFKLGTDWASVQTTIIPEPGTIGLLTTGLLGLLAYAWRKRR